jgi:hypothetical protein
LELEPSTGGIGARATEEDHKGIAKMTMKDRRDQSEMETGGTTKRRITTDVIKRAIGRLSEYASTTGFSTPS